MTVFILRPQPNKRTLSHSVIVSSGNILSLQETITHNNCILNLQQQANSNQLFEMLAAEMSSAVLLSPIFIRFLHILVRENLGFFFIPQFPLKMYIFESNLFYFQSLANLFFHMKHILYYRRFKLVVYATTVQSVQPLTFE